MIPTIRPCRIAGASALRVSVPIRRHEVTRHGKDGPYVAHVWDKRVFIIRADATDKEIRRRIGHVYAENGRDRDDGLEAA